MMQRYLAPRLFAAALALSFGLAAGAGIAGPRGEGPGPRGEGPRGGPPPCAQGAGPQGPGPMFQKRAFGRLHEELKLDEKQEALWKAAIDGVREQRAGMREAFAKERAEIKAMLDQPGADLRAVAKRMDELRAQHAAQNEAVRERWFAFYDSLSDAQKEKARLFYKERMERGERGADKARKGPPRGKGQRGPRRPKPSAPPASEAPAQPG